MSTFAVAWVAAVGVGGTCRNFQAYAATATATKTITPIVLVSNREDRWRTVVNGLAAKIDMLANLILNSG